MWTDPYHDHHAKAAWKGYNIVQVSLDNYDLLLSYPNSSKPNKVTSFYLTIACPHEISILHRHCL